LMFVFCPKNYGRLPTTFSGRCVWQPAIKGDGKPGTMLEEAEKGRKEMECAICNVEKGSP